MENPFYAKPRVRFFWSGEKRRRTLGVCGRNINALLDNDFT